jgi:hypothetical protein
MKKHEREELQQDLSSRILLQVKDLIDSGDHDEARKLMKLYNQLDRGW